MKKCDAVKLRNEDEVIVKKTETPMIVKNIEIVRDAADKMTRVSLLLDDGNWYDHKEVK